MRLAVLRNYSICISSYSLEKNVRFQSLHFGFALRSIVNLICGGKYDKKYVESIFALIFITIKEGAQIEAVYPSYTLCQLYTLILI